MALNILRRPVVAGRIGILPKTTHDHVKRGILPKPVAIGERGVGWPEYEIDAIIKARISGKTEADIRALVISMTAARQHLA